MQNPIVQIERLTHRYGDRVALDNLSLQVQSGEIFAMLGPNGSGKTTLFRILSTLLPCPRGCVHILGSDPADDTMQIRRQIGVVFQSPSLDKHLTAAENLMHQGHLYGMTGAILTARSNDLLRRVGLLDRAHERISNFSGGMRRRVELAKGLLHRPKILLLDEPSTGLDPTARIDLWQLLHEINQEDQVTILLTTHLMDEADRCSRLAILDDGKLLACDPPKALKDRVGGDVITIISRQPDELIAKIKTRFDLSVNRVDDLLRLEKREGHAFVPQLIEAAPGLIESISIGKPTLEDVFIKLTGHRLSRDESLTPEPQHAHQSLARS